MKASADVIKRLELLFEEYEKEVSDKLKSGLIAENTLRPISFIQVISANGVGMNLFQEQEINRNN